MAEFPFSLAFINFRNKLMWNLFYPVLILEILYNCIGSAMPKYELQNVGRSIQNINPVIHKIKSLTCHFSEEVSEDSDSYEMVEFGVNPYEIKV